MQPEKMSTLQCLVKSMVASVDWGSRHCCLLAFSIPAYWLSALLPLGSQHCCLGALNIVSFGLSQLLLPRGSQPCCLGMYAELPGDVCLAALTDVCLAALGMYALLLIGILSYADFFNVKVIQYITDCAFQRSRQHSYHRLWSDSRITRFVLQIKLSL